MSKEQNEAPNLALAEIKRIGRARTGKAVGAFFSCGMSYCCCVQRPERMGKFSNDAIAELIRELENIKKSADSKDKKYHDCIQVLKVTSNRRETNLPKDYRDAIARAIATLEDKQPLSSGPTYDEGRESTETSHHGAL
ncbi:MAG: hypothetical protein M3R00_00325 [Pseudomonadota bacterium]|nr:hypothetical protein [Pseudomonadota bacterium]